MTRLILVTMLVSGVCGLTLAAQRKPVTVERLDILHSPPPATLEGMRDEAAGVVIARFSGLATTTESSASTPGEGLLRTAYTFEVIEVLKPHAEIPLPSHTFEVTLFGGSAELSSRVRRLQEHGVQDLKAGHKYVVFLGINRNTNQLLLPWEAASVFDITTGRVSALAEQARAHDGLDAQQFVTKARVLRQP